MTNMHSGDQILKTDELGRMRTPRERQERLLDEFEQSGLSGAKFAALVGIKYQTFCSWAQRRRRQRQACPSAPEAGGKAVSQMRWLEAVVDKAGLSTASARAALIVQLPGGARMEIADATQAVLAAQLLRSLANPPSVSC